MTSHFSSKIGKRPSARYDGGSKGEGEEDDQGEDAGKKMFDDDSITITITITMAIHLKAMIVFKLGKSVLPKVEMARKCSLTVAVLRIFIRILIFVMMMMIIIIVMFRILSSHPFSFCSISPTESWIVILFT